MPYGGTLNPLFRNERIAEALYVVRAELGKLDVSDKNAPVIKRIAEAVGDIATAVLEKN